MLDDERPASRVSSLRAYIAVAVALSGLTLIPVVGLSNEAIRWQVFAAAYVPPTIELDIDGDGSADPLTDGLLSVRYLFGFRGATLTNGAVNTQGCTRCNATLIEPYLFELTH